MSILVKYEATSQVLTGSTLSIQERITLKTNEEKISNNLHKNLCSQSKYNKNLNEKKKRQKKDRKNKPNAGIILGILGFFLLF